MEELADKLKALLSDPEGVERIMGIARSLGEGGGKEKPIRADSREQQEDNPLQSILKNPELKRLFGAECAPRNELLRALCPFLSQEKKEKLQRILKATSAIETMVTAGSLLG